MKGILSNGFAASKLRPIFDCHSRHWDLKVIVSILKEKNISVFHEKHIKPAGLLKIQDQGVPA